MIRRVISFGCSYAAGLEFLDHEVDSDAERLKHSKGLSWWWQFRHQRDPRDLLTVREAELAWVNLMCVHHGWRFDNRAFGGNSLGHILWQVEQSMLQGQFDQHTLVVVSVSDWERGVYWPPGQAPRPWILADVDHWPRPWWDKATVSDLSSDDLWLWQHLTYLERLNQISEDLGGRLLIFDMNGQRAAIQHQWPPPHHFNLQLEHIIARGHTRFDRCLTGFEQQGERHAGQHPWQVVHRRFAEWACDQVLGF